MNIFIFASINEADYVLKKAVILEKISNEPFKMLKATVENKSIGIVISLIGKVHAGASLVAAINYFGPNNNFINVGTSGSLDVKQANVFDIVIASKLVQHDVDTTALGDPLGMVSGPDKVFFNTSNELNKAIEKGCHDYHLNPIYGIVSSGDKFIASEEEKQNIRKSFNSIVVEMEAAALAEIADAYKVNFSCFKIITDAVEHAKEYKENFDKAVRILADIVWTI
ncbi:MAG TPA: 5'-methylthioadenosine/S-adenosylhomocysteine nucleosidase [Firmicutes bacterium]|nr:5'-methylthioadenosine/S-adenosylhomocysteine nucleosidase [Bacillota bacterium]